MKIEGSYPLDGMKYFQPEKATLTIACPECSNGIWVDVGDMLLEYPSHTQRVEITCPECEHEFDVDIDIKLMYEIEIAKVNA